MYNVLNYGVVADYNPTSNTGTDNTSKLNTLIATAANTKGALYFPAGNYLISTGMVGSLQTGLRLYGDGPNSSILYIEGASSGVSLGGYGFSVSELGFLAVGNAVNSLLTLGGNESAPTKNNPGNYGLVEHCLFSARNLGSDTFQKGIYCQGLWYSSISNCSFVSINNSGDGIYADYSVNVRVQSCNFDFFDSAILLTSNTYPGQSSTCQGWTVTENTSISCNVGFSSATGAYNSCLNNVFDYCFSAGIFCTGQEGSAYCNNWIGVANKPGVSPPKSGQAGLYISGLTCQIANNFVYNYGVAMAAAYYFSNCSFMSCMGNTCDTPGYPTTSSVVISDGISCDSGCSYLTIIGNTLSKCGSVTVNDLSQNSQKLGNTGTVI